MGTIAMEVRRAVVRLREQQRLEYAEIAELLGIGEATVNRILRRYREQGSVDVLPRGGGRRSLIHGRIAKLLVAIVTKMPDATVAELTEALEERASIEISRSAVQRALGRLGYTKKRPRSAPRSKTRPSTVRGGAPTAS